MFGLVKIIVLYLNQLFYDLILSTSLKYQFPTAIISQFLLMILLAICNYNNNISCQEPFFEYYYSPSKLFIPLIRICP